MELFEAIERRASVRQLRAVHLPEGDLERILDAGRRAPSGMNLQPYELISLLAFFFEPSAVFLFYGFFNLR